jgi:hypothetical protein
MPVGTVVPYSVDVAEGVAGTAAGSAVSGGPVTA